MKHQLLLLAIIVAVASAAGDAAIAPVSVKPDKPAMSSPFEDVTIPTMLSYQGKLTDTFGIPVMDTTHSVEFRLYTVPTGGAAFWSETQSIRTRGGLFAALLGAVEAIDDIPSAGSAYLSMAVNGGAELSPRQQLVSAAYSYITAYAGNSNRLQGKETTGFVRTGQANSVTSAMITNGTIAAADLGQMGATNGQVMKWTGSAWAPRNDSVGGGGGGAPDSVPGSFAVTIDLRVYGKGRVGNNTNAGTAAFAAGSGNSAVGNYSSITGGTVNSAGSYAFIGGGSENVANDSFSAVAGGFGNDADAYGFIGAGQGNQTLGAYAVVGAGLGNIASRPQSAVLAGENNRATGVSAFVGAGVSDTASGGSAAVVAGTGNRAAGTNAFVGAGNQNKASGSSAAVVAGTSNRAEQSRAVVAGGWGNVAAGEHSFIGGGEANRASGYDAAVVAGENNLASGAYSVAAGRADTASAIYSAALSGYRNRALDSAAVVVGGDGNIARGRRSFVGGGRVNRADSLHAVVCGGDSNFARGQNSFIGGGFRNTASYASVVGGGNLNTASGNQSVVGGGVTNAASGSYSFVGSGWNVTASGSYSVIPGGDGCIASAVHSFATGSASHSLHFNSAAFNGQTTSADNQTRVGALSKASGTFTIDHPLDPHGKILNHYFIEGPEMRNIYDGETILDASGRAVVRLPDYFAALNRNPRVQLTGVGTYQVYLAEEVTGDRFAVGGPPGTRVYWQVTGERQDVSAEATRRMMPVEQPKTGVLAGRMLDDDFLVGAMGQLEREGNAQGIDFRTAAGRERYRQMQQRLREVESQEGR